MKRARTLKMNQPTLDWWLVLPVLYLLLMGTIMVYSASAFYAERAFQDHLHFLKRQLIWLFVGIAVLAISYRFPVERLAGFSRSLLAAAFLLLVYLALVHRGRWLHLGPFNLQGVELAKFALIVYFAESLSRKETNLASFQRGLLPYLVILLVFGFLVWLQPDFSSAAMLVLLGGLLLLVSPIPLGHLLATAAAIVPLAFAAVMASDYQRARLFSFLHPENSDPAHLHQIKQSLIALGSGGIFGVGFAQGHQKQFFLPEAHTDFIFAIIGEEWGLLGTFSIWLMFFLIFIRGFQIASKSGNRFHFYLAVGATAHLVTYGAVNMMVTLNLLPPTGLPLPFISYGGSAMVFSCLYAGLLLNLSRLAFCKALRNQQQFATRALYRSRARNIRWVRQ